jgi:hypothetical protein
VLDVRHHLSAGCSIGSQHVCGHAPWHGTLFLQQAHQQSLGSLGVAAVLDDLVKEVSVLIEGPPKPMFLTGDADDDFIQMPDIVSGLAPFFGAGGNSPGRISVPTGGLSHRKRQCRVPEASLRRGAGSAEIGNTAKLHGR